MSSTRDENTRSAQSSTSLVPNMSPVPRLRSRGRRGASTSSDRVLHNTVSGGVASSRSSSILPSSQRKKRIGRPPSNRARRVTTIQSDPRLDGSNGNDATNAVNVDLSDDEVQSVPVANHEKDLRRTRSHVLSHFTEEVNGFRCKVCHEVCMDHYKDF